MHYVEDRVRLMVDNMKEIFRKLDHVVKLRHATGVGFSTGCPIIATVVLELGVTTFQLLFLDPPAPIFMDNKPVIRPDLARFTESWHSSGELGDTNRRTQTTVHFNVHNGYYIQPGCRGENAMEKFRCNHRKAFDMFFASLFVINHFSATKRATAKETAMKIRIGLVLKDERTKLKQMVIDTKLRGAFDVGLRLRLTSKLQTSLRLIAKSAEYYGIYDARTEPTWPFCIARPGRKECSETDEEWHGGFYTYVAKDELENHGNHAT